MVKLTVSIVNYNAGDYLIRCLESLEKIQSEALLEIYVVDNASSDDSVARVKKLFPKIHFILNEQNLGFGKAHNQVLKNLQTEFVLILNPDVELEDGNLSVPISYLNASPEVGAVTGEVILSNRQIDLTAHRGFPTPWASFKYYVFKDDSLYHMRNKNMNQIHEVDAISGAFFLTRKSVLDKVGLFDEDYFMYAEDIDLCFRIKQAGYKIMYLPSVKILHHKGVSSGLKKHTQGITTANLQTKQRSLNAFYETMKIFYQKHLAQEYPFFINWLVYLGINLKWWLAKKKLTV
jgi:GT2 family glycosyltransferase